MGSASRTIASLALAKANWDQAHRDHLDAFIPLVATVLSTGSYREVLDSDVHRLCQDFEATFGLQLPYYPMVAILMRARKRGLLTRSRGRFVPVSAALAEHDISKKAAAQEAAIEAFTERFVSFAKQEFSADLTKDEAQGALIAFLREHDLDLLFAATNIDGVLPAVKASRRSAYLLARFIQHVREREPGTFDFLVNVTVGYTLASALLFREFSKYASRLDGVQVYCDTGFVLRLLGVEGPERELSYQVLVSTLLANGARLYVWRHTYDEFMSILKGCRRWVGKRAYDPSRATPAISYFVQRGCSESDVDEFVIQADIQLRRLPISVAEPPAPSELSEFAIDETKLRGTIVSIYTHFQETERGYALDRDIKSIAAVKKLRRGRMPLSIKGCGQLLVTTNGALAYAARRFEAEETPDVEMIPACVTDIFLGTVVWLQSPAVVRVVNETKLIAQCAAAIRLDGAAMRRLVRIAEKLKNDGKVDDEVYYLLRTSSVMHEMLAERSLGDPEAFSPETVEEVVARFEERARRKDIERYQREKEDHDRTRARLVGIEAENAAIETRLELVAEKIAVYVANTLFAVLAAVAVGGFVLPFFGLVQKPIFRIFSILVTLVFGVGPLTYSFNLLSARDSARRAVKSRILRLLTRQTHATGGQETQLDAGQGVSPTER